MGVMPVMVGIVMVHMQFQIKPGKVNKLYIQFQIFCMKVLYPISSYIKNCGQKMFCCLTIDVLWRPKTLGIHFVARLFQKITKSFWRFWHLLSNKLVKIIWEQNECLP